MNTEGSRMFISFSTEKPINIEAAYFKYISFVVIGSFLVIANAPIVVDILRHRVLRDKKEYLLLVGLAFADLLAGLATLIAGSYRLNLVDWREEDDQLSRWDCVGAPHFALLTFASSIQPGMLLVISLDRLIAFLKPLQYNAFSRKYAIVMVAICYFLAAIYTTLLLFYVLFADVEAKLTTIDAVCLLCEVGNAFDSIYPVRIGLASISCILYIVVWYLCRKYQQRTCARFPSIAFRLRRSQRHLTATVGICALFTFILYVVPTSLIALAGILNWKLDFWGPVCWIMTCFNAVINVFVYSLRHEDIRTGLKLLFRCEELPSHAMKRLKNESISLSVCSGQELRRRSESCPY